MSEVPDWVEQYIGLPFVEHGRNRQGVDCWGLVRLVLDEQFGVVLPSYVNGYASTTEKEVLARLILSEITPWREILHGARVGDVALLRVGETPTHVGVVISNGWMLHIERGIDSMKESYLNIRWRNRLVGIYRYENMLGIG